MNSDELSDFIKWYWLNVQGKPYHMSSLDLAEDYIQEKRKSDEAIAAWKREKIRNNSIK